MKLNSRRRETSLSMDLTPLIDIVFLLLIFFLVTTTFTKKKMEKPDAIPVNLPAGATGEEVSDDEAVVLTVTAAGGVQIDDGEPLSDDALLEKMKSIYSSKPEQPIMLRGDAGSSHGRIIEVLDKIKLSGFQKVNLIVKKQLPTPG